MPLKDIPTDEQPREKLIKYGVLSLSNAELLAIILRVGNRNQSVLELSRKILEKFSIKDLSEITPEQLSQFDGIKTAKAAQVIACFELARRLASYREEKIVVANSKDIADLLMPELRYKTKEHLIGIYLDKRNHVIRKEIITIGILDSSPVHPREVFVPAIQSSSKSVIIAHNHPSGSIAPSNEDIQMTKRLVQAGKIIGIEILDHIIIGENDFFSFKDKGMI